MIITAVRPRWKDISAVLTLTAAFALCMLGGRWSADLPSVAASASLQTIRDPAEYLEALGWRFADNPIVDEIVLPEVFDQPYTDFLAVQAEGGFTLEDYAGQTVTRYSYPLSNYPSGEQVWGDLLLYEGKLVGGELRSSAVDGFIAPLSSREDVIKAPPQ